MPVCRVPANVGVVPLTYAASITTNAAQGSLFSVTLTGNGVLANPTNLLRGQTYTWLITQDSTGSRTLTYGTLFLWLQKTPPVLTTAAASTDLISGVYNGTSLFCTYGTNFG